MTTSISHGIKVSVEATYEAKHSDPFKRRYLFSYRIAIENTGANTVKLLNRHWKIRDSVGPMRIVNGEGVVGEKPVIRSGERFTYTSACDLTTDLGTMRGHYLMQDLQTKEMLQVRIPQFTLMTDWRKN